MCAAKPCYCLRLLLLPCTNYSIRKDALGGDLRNYRCFQMYYCDAWLLLPVPGVMDHAAYALKRSAACIFRSWRRGIQSSNGIAYATCAGELLLHGGLRRLSSLLLG